jgi:hypothetical protein
MFLATSKLLILWWPGTESNRRRQPFQGCNPPVTEEVPGAKLIEAYQFVRAPPDSILRDSTHLFFRPA